MSPWLGTNARALISSLYTRAIGENKPAPPSWAVSSVSTFGTRYAPPVPDLPAREAVEALVEGSEMSLLQPGGPTDAAYSWARREGRARRYEHKRVGGTVTVHFIKNHAWFLETALALLEGDEVTETDREGVALDNNLDLNNSRLAA
jgi:hypothetical protein